MRTTTAATTKWDRNMKWEVLRRERSLPHLTRKLYHGLMGLLCFSLYAFVLNRDEALIALGAIGGLLVVLDIFRLRHPGVNTVALKVFGRIMRREELKSISGNSFYILGLLVVVIFFSKPIVLLSVLFLALGDPLAAVVGSRWGRTKLIGKKSLEGALACFAGSALAAGLFTGLFLGQNFLTSLAMGLIGGLISTTAELIPTPIDDNFTIPVFSATLLFLFSQIFTSFSFL